MTEYPEHDKLAAVRDAADAVGEFLEAMQERGYVLAEWVRYDDYHDVVLAPVTKGIDTLLAEHFEIDLATLEKEKRDMLRAIRGL